MNFAHETDMCIFMLTSGVCTSAAMNIESLRKNFILLLVPGFLFTTLEGLIALCKGEDFPVENLWNFQPWYLKTLFLLRVATCCIGRTKDWALVLVGMTLFTIWWLNVGYSSIARNVEYAQSDMSQAALYLPFYMAGFLMKKHGIVNWYTSKLHDQYLGLGIRTAACAALISIGVVIGSTGMQAIA